MHASSPLTRPGPGPRVGWCTMQVVAASWGHLLPGVPIGGPASAPHHLWAVASTNAVETGWDGTAPSHWGWKRGGWAAEGSVKPVPHSQVSPSPSPSLSPGLALACPTALGDWTGVGLGPEPPSPQWCLHPLSCPDCAEEDPATAPWWAQREPALTWWWASNYLFVQGPHKS